MIGLVVALVAGVALLRAPASLATGPRDPVEGLVVALESGDMERILEIVGFAEFEQREFRNVRSVERGGLFSPEAISQGWELPGIELGEAVEQSHQEELTRERPGVHRTQMRFGDIWAAGVLTARDDAGWVRDWELLTPHASHSVTGGVVLPHAPLGPVTFGGATLAPDHREVGVGENSADALVGIYQVTYAHPMFEPATETVAVRSDMEARLTLPIGEVREEVVEFTEERVTDHIESCLEEATVLRPTGCVVGYDPGHYISLRGEASWEIESMPDVELTPTSADENEGRPRAVVTTTTPGRASVTYALIQREERTVEVEMEVGGHVKLDLDGELVWRP